MNSIKARFKRMSIGRTGKDPNASGKTDAAASAERTPNEGRKNAPANSNAANVDSGLAAARMFIKDEREGSLVFTIQVATAYRPRIAVDVHRFGKEQGDGPYGKLAGLMKMSGAEHGFVEAEHPSFELYRIQRKYLRRHSESPNELNEEDCILFDPEASPLYDHAHANGTVTVEGFGLDLWNAELAHGRMPQRAHPNLLLEVPDLTFDPATLLCRIEEIRSGTVPADDPEEQIAALVETVGKVAWEGIAGSWEMQEMGHSERVLEFLFAFHHEQEDISGRSVIAKTMTRFQEGSYEGAWADRMRMVMALRLASGAGMGMQGAGGTKGIYARFTRAILASLITSERWVANTRIHVGGHGALAREVQDAKAAGVPEQDRQEARELVRLAEEATEAKQFQRAAVFFYKALAVNPANYDTVQARGEWLLRFQNYRDAARDAVILQRLDPDRPAGYVLLGRACLGYKNYLRAREAFREAVPLAHAFDEKLPILQDLDKAQDALGAELKAIEQAAGEKEKAALMRARRIADLDPMGRTIAPRPAKDEQQLEGLFLFAERMQWPYLEAVRLCAKKAREDWLASHEPIYPVQVDWLFAVVLPGKHFAHVLMAMLVLSTPAIQSVGMAPNSECGVALPECSYWRSRSVLGRVLGCLPGVTSLNGWVGPCPAATLHTQTDEEAPAAHCLITTVAFNPASALLPPPSAESTRDIVIAGNLDLAPLWRATNQPEIFNLHPPQRDTAAWELRSLDLRRAYRSHQFEPGGTWLWSASLAFRQPGTGKEITFALDHTPVFITLPPCSLSDQARGHKIHRRQLDDYRFRNVSMNEIAEVTPESVEEEIIIINASAPGAEVVARAWCAHVARAAVVRRAGGPCLYCTVKWAGRLELRVGVVIWAS
ncbi:hypothetical protein HAV15_011591 [Penicillium sp. str. |nr:hypothetical protein HAV15_011591 [Penicillium sp. str. \